MESLRSTLPLALLLSLGAGTFTNLARAQADDATRAAARSLGYEGINDFEAGNFPSAADKLDRAYRALRVPSLGLWSARALEETGKLVAAAERYLEVQRLDPGAGEVAVQKQAQLDAQAEHDAIAPRIPHVLIQIEGSPIGEATVSVDGTAVPSSLIGVKRPVDPGTVTLEVRHGDRSATQRVTLKEGETKTVVFRLNASAGSVPAPAASGAAPQPSDAGTESQASGSALRTLGFVAIGVGGASIVAGAVAGGLATARRNSIEGCEETRCPPSASSDVEAYNDLRVISSALFIGGGIVAATGVVLLLTTPTSGTAPAAAPSVALAPWLGNGGGGFVLEARQ